MLVQCGDGKTSVVVLMVAHRLNECELLKHLQQVKSAWSPLRCESHLRPAKIAPAANTAVCRVLCLSPPPQRRRTCSVEDAGFSLAPSESHACPHWSTLTELVLEALAQRVEVHLGLRQRCTGLNVMTV